MHTVFDATRNSLTTHAERIKHKSCTGEDYLECRLFCHQLTELSFSQNYRELLHELNDELSQLHNFRALRKYLVTDADVSVQIGVNKERYLVVTVSTPINVTAYQPLLDKTKLHTTYKDLLARDINVKELFPNGITNHYRLLSVSLSPLKVATYAVV